MYVYLSLPGHQPEKYHIKIFSFFLSNYVISMCIWWTTHGGPFWGKNSKNPQKLGFTIPPEFCIVFTYETDENYLWVWWGAEISNSALYSHFIFISINLSVYISIYQFQYIYISIYPYLGTRTVSILQFSCGSRWQSSLGMFCTKSRDSVLQTWNKKNIYIYISFEDKSHCPNGLKCMIFEELSNFEEIVF